MADVFPVADAGWAGVAALSSGGGSGGGGGADGSYTDDSSSGPFDHPSVAGLRVQKRVRSANGLVVDFVDDALWLLAINGQSFTNP